MRGAPERMCAVCRERRPKHALLRVALGPEGDARLDALGKLPGRGAYVCRREACWKAQGVSGALGRALRVTLPPQQAKALSLEALGCMVARLPLGKGAEPGWRGDESGVENVSMR